jgi:hypothetical protein
MAPPPLTSSVVDEVHTRATGRRCADLSEDLCPHLDLAALSLSSRGSRTHDLNGSLASPAHKTNIDRAPVPPVRDANAILIKVSPKVPCQIIQPELIFDSMN